MITMRTRRARVFVLVLAAWGLLVVSRLAELQIAQGARYRARAQRQQERRIELSARRGSILDRQGRELAVSVEATSAYAIPDEIESPQNLARELSPLLEIPASTLASKMTQKRGFVWLARKIAPAAADRLRAKKPRGIHFVAESRRFYPKGALGASVLGFVGTDDRGLAGLEYLYDQKMRGKAGEIVALTDARRSTYGEETGGGRSPEEGSTLTVSIDSGIQFIVEQELAATLRQYGARSGSVVLLDPFTGEVLAMASAPGFDPNQYGRFPADARRNRAIADAYEPGSTFKIVTGAAALERGVVRLDEVIETGHGAIRIGNVTISEDEHHDYGPLTLAGVFEHSSNVGIIRVGVRLGPERLFSGASALGIGRTTGVDLPGESSGIFRPLVRWSSLSNASISMGQEVALTALQLARVVAIVANGGFLVQPRLVTRVTRPDGRVERIGSPSPTRVISPETAQALRRILVGVVEKGTGTTAAIPGFKVGGKTGTAQKAGPGGYQAGRYVPNFVGFAPAEVPRVVAVVVVEEPQGKYYAREVAAPLFARIVSQVLGILRVAPREQRVPETVLASSAGAALYPVGLVPASVRLQAPPPRPAAFGETPDVSGLSARQALAVFARLGLTARFRGAGFVASQYPSAGSTFRPGETHTLFLTETVPSMIRPNRGREETSSPLPLP